MNNSLVFNLLRQYTFFFLPIKKERKSRVFSIKTMSFDKLHIFTIVKTGKSNGCIVVSKRSSTNSIFFNRVYPSKFSEALIWPLIKKYLLKIVIIEILSL